MADWTKFNGERMGRPAKLSSSLSSDEDDENDQDHGGSARVVLSPSNDTASTTTTTTTSSSNNNNNSGNNNNPRRNLSRQRSRESSRNDDATAAALVRRSLVKSRTNSTNEDLVSILASNESLVPVSRLGYENDLALVDEAGRRILEQRNNQDNESGSKVRRDAKRELQQERQQQSPPKRPNSLYKEDILGSQKLKNIFNSEKDGLFDKQQPTKDELIIANEKTSSKLINGDSKGTSPCAEKQSNQHHVQFNRNLLKPNSNNGKPEPENPRASPSISTSSSSSSEDNSSLGQLSEARPPDGGWGWVVVAAAFMVNLIADGITFSFGVIFHEFLEYFGETKATTSWIGSLFMAMPLLSGPIASFLTDRYGCRKVTIAGSILATTGFVISYFANSMGVLILTFGVLAGFGLSLCFVAAVVIVAYYFDKRRSFATGLSVCGSGIGTFIFPPLIQKLLNEYGWRGTTLILAGLFLNLAVCGCLMRDLEWTTMRAKVKTEERKRSREQRRLRIQSSSVDSFSASSSANTAQTEAKRGASANAMIIEGLRDDHENPGGEKLFSSLVSLPTFVKNGEKVPLEVLELLSNRKNVYNVLVQNYPSLLISSRSFSDSGNLHEQINSPSARFVPTLSPLAIEDRGNMGAGGAEARDFDPQVRIIH